MSKLSKSYNRQEHKLYVNYPKGTEVDLLRLSERVAAQRHEVFIQVKDNGVPYLVGIESSAFSFSVQWPLADFSGDCAELSKRFSGLLYGCDEATGEAINAWSDLKRTTWMNNDVETQRERNLREDRRTNSSINAKAIIHCSTVLREFIRQWPQVDEFTTISRASWLPGGIVSKQDTLRNFIRRPEILPDNSPAWSSRRVHNLHPFQSNKLAVELKYISHLISDNDARGKQYKPCMAFIKDLGFAEAGLKTSTYKKEAHEATWPSAAKRLLESIKALHLAEASDGLASGVAQVLYEEDAYEIWCAVALRKSLCRLLGDTKPIGYLYSTEQGIFSIRLKYQHHFTRRPEVDICKNLISVTSGLIPDFTLSIMNVKTGQERVYLLDAKLYTADKGGFLAEASKYLWGIRRNDQIHIDEDSFVESVTLINTDGGLRGIGLVSGLNIPYDTALSRIQVLGATPGLQGDQAILNHIKMLLEQAAVPLPVR